MMNCSVEDHSATAVDINHTDVSNPGDSPHPPTSNALSSYDVFEWFTSHPSGDDAAIRLLTYPNTRLPSTSSGKAVLPFSHETIDHAVWRPEVYLDLACNPSGGCAAMLDEPWRFILQSPSNDGGPFVSMALSRRGIVVKGVYLYDGDIFEPTSVLKGVNIGSGWRSAGMQIISFPQGIAKAHASYISQQITGLAEQVTEIERTLALYSGRPNLAHHSADLQRIGAALMDLERRARFQKQVVSAIETVTGSTRYGSVPWPPLAPIKSTIETWAFEFETMPRRIENARATISNLIQQHNEQLNLEIAESSRRMTEAALVDNASMKTIAILTMVFLPGTAVASFFSMSMFDWSASNGNALASGWLWVFFVVATPLTAAVLLIWWVWGHRNARDAMLRSQPRDVETAFRDVEPQQEIASSQDVEMEDIGPSSKGEER